MIIPRKLSIVRLSPNYDAKAARAIDKVFVDGIHLPDCVAYDIDQGWAFNRVNGVWQPKKFGKITVTLKAGSNAEIRRSGEGDRRQA